MNVSGAYSLIQLEEIDYSSPVSSSVFNRIAAVVNQALATSTNSALGTVELSMLTEAQFQSQKGSNWVLMDGRSVAGSLYASTFGVTNIPDGRGLFLRAKDNGAGNDPFGELATGTAQLNNSYQAHSHGGTISIQQGAIPVSFTAYSNIFNNGGTASGRYHGSAYFETPPSPQQFATIANGGNESRARNITTNFFIKIN